MVASQYLNLFLDAGITRDQETWGRCIDAVLAQEGITAADIVGLGELGITYKALYVVHRRGITRTQERGVFKKRIEQDRLCSIESIARLRKTKEGTKPPQLTITANGADGQQLARIVWDEGFEDWEKRSALRQREHLFEIIGRAMDLASAASAPPSVPAGASKARAIMEWAAAVLRAADVQVTAERVHKTASTVAAGVVYQVFMPLGEQVGISDLELFYAPDPWPGVTIDTFDDFYRRVVVRLGTAAPVDEGIDATLAGAWDMFVDGCRERYSPA